jgi:photoactive yellow protein
MKTTPVPLDVDAPHLAEAVEQLSPEQLNMLPFGAIRLDSRFNVVVYNDVERQQSGYRKEVIGRPFFLEIAPCLNTDACKDRIDRALANGKLDMTFDHTADLPSGAMDVDLHVRVLPATGGGCWIFTKVED